MSYALLIYNAVIKTKVKSDRENKYLSPYTIVSRTTPVFNFPIFGFEIVARSPRHSNCQSFNPEAIVEPSYVLIHSMRNVQSTTIWKSTACCTQMIMYCTKTDRLYFTVYIHKIIYTHQLKTSTCKTSVATLREHITLGIFHHCQYRHRQQLNRT